MKTLKRAILSINKQFKKTFILICLMTVVMTMLTIGLSIQQIAKDSNEAAKKYIKPEITIENKENTNLLHAGKYDPTTFLNKNTINEISKSPGVNSIQKKIDSAVVPNFKNNKINSSNSNPSNLLAGLDNFKNNEDFKSGKLKLINGTYPYDSKEQFPLMVSEKFAYEHHLKIGDTLFINGGNLLDKKIKYTITALFKNKNLKSERAEDRNPLLKPENNFYSTSTAVEALKALDNPKQLAEYQAVVLKLDGIDKIENVISSIKNNKNISSENLKFKSDFEEFQKMNNSIDNMDKIATLILVISGIAGVVILSLVIIISLRERKFEMGILLSIGASKKNVVLQIISEVLIVFLLSFFIAVGLCSMSQNKINTMSEQMLTTETLSEQTTSANTDPGSNTINHDLTTNITQIFIPSFGFGIIIILLSTLIPLIFFLRTDPKIMMLDQE